MALELDQLHAKLVALLGQQLAIQQYTGALDMEQNFGCREFNFGVDQLQLCGAGNLRIERLVQTQSDIGVFRRVKAGGINVHLIKANLFCALASDFFVMHGLVVEVAQGQRVHTVRFVRFQHIGLKQGIVGNPL